MAKRKDTRKRKRPNPKHPGVNDQHVVAVELFFKHGCNKEAAMREMGLSEHYATRFFNRPKVRALIEAKKRKIALAADVTAEWMMREYVKLYVAICALDRYMKVGDGGVLYHDFTGATEEELAAVQELTVEEFVKGSGERSQRVLKTKFSKTDRLTLMRDMRKLGGLDKAEKLDVNVTGTLEERILAGLKNAGAE